jgi:hypothetical protein
MCPCRFCTETNIRRTRAPITTLLAQFFWTFDVEFALDCRALGLCCVLKKGRKTQWVWALLAFTW